MAEFATENEIIEVQKETNVDEKKWCVYIHTAPNDKKYVGITSLPVNIRWHQNGTGYKKQQYFWRAIQKWGWENFSHEVVLENVTFEEACNAERDFIQYYQTNDKNFGYNATEGGAGTQGHRMTDEQKEILSKSAKERFANPENHPRYGVTLSDETKQKIKNSLTGKYTKETHPNTGRKHTDETRKKMSKSHKGKNTGEDNYWFGKHLPDDVKKQLSKKAKERYADPTNHPMYGKHYTDEEKEKMSIRAKIAWINKCIPVYSVELDAIYQGATDVNNKLGFDASGVIKCCKGKLNSLGKNPITGERLHWKYVYDQEQKDGTIIPGAITLGYITEERVNNYLNNLKQKEIDL